MTLFEAQVSALRAFRLLASEARTPKLAGEIKRQQMTYKAEVRYQPRSRGTRDVFSDFYISMVRAGEETAN